MTSPETCSVDIVAWPIQGHYNGNGRNYSFSNYAGRKVNILTGGSIDQVATQSHPPNFLTPSKSPPSRES